MSNELHCRSKKLLRSSSDEEDVNSDEGEESEDIMRNFPRSTADVDLKPDIQKHSSESDQRNQSKRNEKSESASRLNLLAKQDSNISDSSKTKARSLPEEARTILHEWYDKHSRNPTKDEKQELLRQTGIDPKQLKNWFCNTRQKEKKNQVSISARERKNIYLSEKPLNAKQQKLGLERESERNSNELERKPSDSIDELNERYSKYEGVYHSIIAQKYKAQTTTPQNRCLGYFNLATDAARAVDIANIDMNTPGRVFNFESDDEYMMSREKELEEIGVNVKTSFKDGKLEGKRLEHCLVYRGVAYQRTTMKFKSILFHNLTQKCLGTFALAADAAWRFDLEVLKSNAPGWPRNFESRQSYVAARANELEGGSSDIHSDAEKDRETIVSWEKENQSFEDIQAKSNAKDSRSARSTSFPFPNSTDLANDLDSNIEHKKSNMHNIGDAKEATKVEQRDDSKSPNAAGNDSIDRKKKVSVFHGVHFMNNRNKYSAKIGQRYLGSFHLESDAARAYDISARQLKIPGCNFGSDGDYVRYREKELNSHCSKVDNADTGEETEGLGHLTYRGVSYNKTSGKYKSILFHNLKQNSLGSFTLAADAAMAFDMEVKRLDAPGWPLNFDNRQSYKLARNRELEEHGEKAERDSDKIKSQWWDYLKVRSKDPAFPPYVDQDEQCDDGMIRTNDHHNITSNEVRQKGTKDFSQVVEAQGSTSQSNQRDHNMVDASVSSEGDRQTGDEAKMESTSKLAGRQTCRTRENEAELEIGNAKRARLNEEATQDDRSKHVDHQNNDDFETNTDSNAEGRITVPESNDGEKLNDGVTVVPVETSQGVMENMNVGITIKGAYCDSNDGLDYSEIRAFQDQYSSKKSRNLLMQLTTDQIEVLNCPFPVGTLVWMIAHCKKTYPVSFVVGRVVAVWMDLTEKVIPYEIQLNQSNTATSSIFVPENRIVFAPECPVSILAAKSWCPGRILCCDIKQNSQDPAAILQPSYIVQLHRNHGVFQRVQGIEPVRIKYRKINEDLSPSCHISNHANQCLSQFGTSGKKELKDDERGVDEIKSSQMSPRSLENFSPKSPMPSRDHRLQKSPNGEVSSTTCNDDVERALPRSGKMDRVDKQSKEGKTHEHSSIDAAMKPPKWDPPAPRCAQIPNDAQVFNAQKSSSNNKSTLNHTPRPPKWHPPASHDISMPGKLSSGGANGEERKRARSPSSPRITSAKDLPQKYTHERESSGRIPHCRVHFPKWLFYDNMAKDHLMYQFTKKSNPPENTNLLTVIGQKTNCSLRLENYESSRIFDRTHIFIESNKMTNDPINVRDAKEQIEDFLLKYIQHDGCQGRLLYDMARGDTVFHPRSNVRHFAGSVAIMQRNPFSRRREIGWMSVVELPFEVDHNSRRLYHGHSLIGLQSRLRNEFSCLIKLCGNEFKRYPMKHGNPYAWVWGKRAQDVDSAIEVILAELKHHRRECRRCQFEGR